MLISYVSYKHVWDEWQVTKNYLLPDHAICMLNAASTAATIYKDVSHAFPIYSKYEFHRVDNIAYELWLAK